MEYDYLDEVWRHLNDGQIECEDTGQNDDELDDVFDLPRDGHDGYGRG